VSGTARIRCTINGVCGKEKIHQYSDLLIYACQGLAFTTIEAGKNGIDTNNRAST
jgi:hydroxylamine reductase (hybrid-cluster protein)